MVINESFPDGEGHWDCVRLGDAEPMIAVRLISKHTGNENGDRNHLTRQLG